jgi:hypothetical protein
MSSIDSLLKQARLIELQLSLRETRLPYLVQDFDTGGDLPGFEAHIRKHEQITRRLCCHPKIYGFDPCEEEGSED